jgi:hypothetical protein
MNITLSTLSSPSRRKLIAGGSALTAAFLLPGGASSATGGIQVGPATMKNVKFKNGPIDLAGHLYLPKGFDEHARHPAVVSIHPGGGVKEQTAGAYARRLAEQGFVALAFDASHQGASGGMPRFLGPQGLGREGAGLRSDRDAGVGRQAAHCRGRRGRTGLRELRAQGG